MAPKLTDQKDIDFVFYEQLQVDRLLSADKYKNLNKKLFNMVVKEARNLAVKEIFPTYAEYDEIGVNFESGAVRVPD